MYFFNKPQLDIPKCHEKIGMSHTMLCSINIIHKNKEMYYWKLWSTHSDLPRIVTSSPGFPESFSVDNNQPTNINTLFLLCLTW